MSIYICEHQEWYKVFHNKMSDIVCCSINFKESPFSLGIYLLTTQAAKKNKQTIKAFSIKLQDGVDLHGILKKKS